LVKGQHYEDLSQKTEQFKQLEQAIVNRQCIQFNYKDKTYRAQPYKLVNHTGIWYLAAIADEQLKAFSFSKLTNLIISTEPFTSDPETHQRIEQEDGIWFTATKREVILKIDSSVAHYFQRRDLLPHQRIDKILEDGSLIISSRIAHDHQILPLIRYWLPSVHVISPDELRHSLLQGLREYLSSNEARQ
jgi:predicted DNA-binding transcriptional regulator YafY